MNSSGKIIKPLILVLLLIAHSLEYVFGQDILFQPITIKNGLSNSYANCMLQDRVGFIWFGTDDGLNLFDGYSFKVFKNDPSDSSSLSDNFIYSIYEDNNGVLYFQTPSRSIQKYNLFLTMQSKL